MIAKKHTEFQDVEVSQDQILNFIIIILLRDKYTTRNDGFIPGSSTNFKGINFENLVEKILLDAVLQMNIRTIIAITLLLH